MKITNTLCLLSLLASTNAWNCSPSKVKSICRKTFLVGAAGAAVAVGTATAAGAAVAVNQVNNNRSGPYEPAPNSLTDKVIIVTGGSTGLGLESAKRLAAAGATIVLTSRTQTKGEKAVESVQSYVSEKGISDAKIYNLVLDLDNLDSVKAFRGAFEELGLKKIDVLLNNAGVMAIPDRQLTVNGYERTFQSNHLGHFVLTAGLYPLLNREKATVVNVSSEAYQFAANGNKQGLDLDNLNGESKYGAWSSYGLSKLANIMFTQELQRRADAVGDSWLNTATLHPGAVSTDLGRYIVGEEKWNSLKTDGPSFFESIVLNTSAAFLKTIPEGASTQIFLAAGADDTLEKGAFYDNLKPKSLPSWATDAEKAKALWEKSEELGGVQFDISNPSKETSLISSAAEAGENKA